VVRQQTIFIKQGKRITSEDLKALRLKDKQARGWKRLIGRAVQLTDEEKEQIRLFVRSQGILGKIGSELGSILAKAFRFGILYKIAVEAMQLGFRAIGATVREIAELDRIAGQIAKVNISLFGEGDNAERGVSNLNAVMGQAFEISKRYGTELEKTAESMALFFQQGLTTTEAVSRTDGAMKLATATGLQLNESVEILTASMKIFGETINDPIVLVDALTAVEQQHAITAQNLARALLQAGSTADALGLSFQDLIGLTTAIGVATRQTGKEVGNALRFILPRFFSTDAVRELSQQQIALFKINRDGTRDLRDLSSVLTDLSGKWNTLNDSQQANLAVTLAGRRRLNTFLALMNNFQQSLLATADALDSQGRSQAAVDTITGRLDRSLEELKTTLKEVAFTIGQAGLRNLLSGLIGITRVIAAFFRIPIDDFDRDLTTVVKSTAEFADSVNENFRDLPKMARS
jgi:TP901 family phage tail tape measure protein